MGPWDDNTDAGSGTASDFWGNLTDQLFAGGAAYFGGKLRADTQIELSNVYANAFVQVVKFVAIAAAVAFVVKGLFGGIKKLF